MGIAAVAKLDFDLVHRDNALTCQLCGSPTTVKDSRPVKHFGFTTTLRRRACVSCNKRYSTMEITTQYYRRMHMVAVPTRLHSTIHMLRAFIKHVDETEGEDHG